MGRWGDREDIQYVIPMPVYEIVFVYAKYKCQWFPQFRNVSGAGDAQAARAW